MAADVEVIVMPVAPFADTVPAIHDHAVSCRYLHLPVVRYKTHIRHALNGCRIHVLYFPVWYGYEVSLLIEALL